MEQLDMPIKVSESDGFENEMKESLYKDLVPYEDSNYVKSNILIGAKYNSSLIEDKLTAYAFSIIDEAEETPGGNLVLKIPASKLKKKLNATNGSFYTALGKAAKAMTGRTVGFNDPENQQFVYRTVITDAEYKNSVLTLEFNGHLRNYLKGLKKNYTILDLGIMVSFKSNHSFKLYELLKSRAYYSKADRKKAGRTPKERIFLISFSLAELKIHLGLVNANLEKVKDVLNGSEHPDYDKAVAVAEEKKANRWSDFKSDILDKAIKEINEKTDMYIQYTTLGAGNGGKIYQIDFMVSFKNDICCSGDDIVIEKKELSEESKEHVLDVISELVPVRIKYSEMVKIAETASYDEGLIRTAFEVLSHQKKVDNVVGFLISAIKEEYGVPVSYGQERKPYRPSNERTYTEEEYRELEKKMMNR